MFLTLTGKEIRQNGKSLIYLLYIVLLVVFFASQLGGIGSNMISAPKEGQEDYSRYGYKTDISEEDIMRSALGKLVTDYYHDVYVTYPVGYTKYVTLSEDEKAEIADIIRETTGLENDRQIEESISAFYAENTADGSASASYSVEPMEDLTYDTFLEKMARVAEILGPGSEFTEDRMRGSTMIPLDYEGAKQAYAELVEKDGYTGGYARLFCDYMGIVAGILPVFPAVTRMLRDRRAGVQELLYVRKASSASVILSRYAALAVLSMAPVMLLSLLPLADCIAAQGGSIRLDYLAFLKYDLGWILPTILFVLAVGVFFTEFTDSALGVLIQAVIWFCALMQSMNRMQGGAYGWNLIPRHNTQMNYGLFAEGFSQLVKNRVLYTVLALVLAGLTILVYEVKRKGRLRRRGKILRSRKRVS